MAAPLNRDTQATQTSIDELYVRFLHALASANLAAAAAFQSAIASAADHVVRPVAGRQGDGASGADGGADGDGDGGGGGGSDSGSNAPAVAVGGKKKRKRSAADGAGAAGATGAKRQRPNGNSDAPKSARGGGGGAGKPRKHSDSPEPAARVRPGGPLPTIDVATAPLDVVEQALVKFDELGGMILDLFDAKTCLDQTLEALCADRVLCTRPFDIAQALLENSKDPGSALAGFTLSNSGGIAGYAMHDPLIRALTSYAFGAVGELFAKMGFPHVIRIGLPQIRIGGCEQHAKKHQPAITRAMTKDVLGGASPIGARLCTIIINCGSVNPGATDVELRVDYGSNTLPADQLVPVPPTQCKRRDDFNAHACDDVVPPGRAVVLAGGTAYTVKLPRGTVSITVDVLASKRPIDANEDLPTATATAIERALETQDQSCGVHGQLPVYPSVRCFEWPNWFAGMYKMIHTGFLTDTVQAKDKETRVCVPRFMPSLAAVAGRADGDIEMYPPYSSDERAEYGIYTVGATDTDGTVDAQAGVVVDPYTVDGCDADKGATGFDVAVDTGTGAEADAAGSDGSDGGGGGLGTTRLSKPDYTMSTESASFGASRTAAVLDCFGAGAAGDDANDSEHDNDSEM